MPAISEGLRGGGGDIHLTVRYTHKVYLICQAEGPALLLCTRAVLRILSAYPPPTYCTSLPSFVALLGNHAEPGHCHDEYSPEGASLCRGRFATRAGT